MIIKAYSIKEIGQFFIQGVSDGPMLDYRAFQDGDRISIYRVSLERYEVKNVLFSDIQTNAGLSYPTSDQTYNYLLEELSPEPPQAQALKASYRAAEAISAVKLVYFSGDGVVSLASNLAFETSLVVGLSLTAGDAGQFVDVRLFGVVSDESLNYGINRPVFLTTNGNTSIQPPTSGTLTRVGKSLGTGSIFVKIEEPIQL